MTAISQELPHKTILDLKAKLHVRKIAKNLVKAITVGFYTSRGSWSQSGEGLPLPQKVNGFKMA